DAVAFCRYPDCHLACRRPYGPLGRTHVLLRRNCYTAGAWPRRTAGDSRDRAGDQIEPRTARTASGTHLERYERSSYRGSRARAARRRAIAFGRDLERAIVNGELAPRFNHRIRASDPATKNCAIATKCHAVVRYR